MRRAALILVTLLLACPLFAWPGTGFDDFRLPAVLILVAALLGVCFALAARGSERPSGPAPLRTAGVLLLAVHLVSLVAARRFADGVSPILVLFAGVSAYACLRAGVIRRESALRLAPLIAGVGLLVAGIGIGQQMLGREAVALEGNRNYAGALAAMLLPPAVAFTRTEPRPSRWLAGAAAAALAVLLLLSESRGGFAAAAVGLLIAGGALGAKRVRGGAPTAALALLLLVGTAALLQGKKQLSTERLETLGFRMNVARSGLRMFLARPLLGWGAGSFEAEYPPYRSEDEFRYSHKHVEEGFKEVEDPHSSWVQTAVETGAPGLLALLLVAYVAARLWRYYVKTASDPETAGLLAGLGGGAAAYLVAGLSNTLTLKTSDTLLFWLFLGLIEILGDRRPWRRGGPAREAQVAIPAAAAIVAVFGAFWAGSLGMANAWYIEAMTTQKSPQGREAPLRQAIEANSSFWKAHYELSRALSALGRHQGAADEGHATLRLRPSHVEALNQTAISVIRAGGDPAEAERLLRRGTEVAPFYYKSFYNLGVLERQRGRRAEARAALTRAVELEPDYGLAWYCRGAVLFSAGEAAPALEDFRKALLKGVNVAGMLRSELPAAANDSRYAEFFR
jgi:O-antigen ligase